MKVLLFQPEASHVWRVSLEARQVAGLGVESLKLSDVAGKLFGISLANVLRDALDVLRVGHLFLKLLLQVRELGCALCEALQLQGDIDKANDLDKGGDLVADEAAQAALRLRLVSCENDELTSACKRLKHVLFGIEHGKSLGVRCLGGDGWLGVAGNVERGEL